MTNRPHSSTSSNALFLTVLCAQIQRPKRRRVEERAKFVELCTNKGPNEFFRLNAESDCREVFQCSEFGLIPLRCPSGLVFDVEKQTCDWRRNVRNCKQLESKFWFQLNYQLISTNLKPFRFHTHRNKTEITGSRCRTLDLRGRQTRLR